MRDGEIAASHVFGVASAATRQPVVDDTVFEAASLSKPVFAYAALRMVERGELDLDRPLLELLPYERLEHDERARQITARMVLSHTSGLPNWGASPLELNRAPGSGWGYSGEGFVLLQRVIEKRTGSALDDIVRREVFEPLGMEHSSFVWQPSYDRESAVGHDLLGGPSEKRRPEDANAAASLHTTARDYARFLSALMSGEGLGEEAHRSMLEPSAAVEGRGPEETLPHLRWSLGVGLQLHGDQTSLWHWGDNGVFRCFFLAQPEEQTALVYFTNSISGLAIVEDLLALFFDEEPWAARWVDYERWDDEGRQARIELQTAALEGVDRALEAYDRLSTALPKEVNAATLEQLSQFLADRSKPRQALELLRRGTGDKVTSRTLIKLGELHVELGEYEQARKSYLEAKAANTAQAKVVDPRIAWLDEGLDAAKRPTAPSPDQLGRYSGRYGPRRVVARNGGLQYAREGATEETRLIALSDTLFRLESNNAFRLRFVFERDGEPASKVVGLYADGNTDESLRTGSTAEQEAVIRPTAVTSLFNGHDLSGWHADVPRRDADPSAPDSFIVRNGVLVSRGEPRGHLITDARYADYRLTVEYRFPGQGGNCGVLVHASTPRALYDMFPQSIEVQMQAGDAGDFWCIEENIEVPDMVSRRPRKDGQAWGGSEGDARRILNLTDGSEEALGEWNTMVIEARHDSIKVWVNGDLVNHGTNATATSGQIAIQAEGTEVELRRIEIGPVGR